jgi:hypothetical protein
MGGRFFFLLLLSLFISLMFDFSVMVPASHHSSSGIFYVNGGLSPSTITNSTFTEIAKLSNPNGSVVNIYVKNCLDFTINRCVFVKCASIKGGALYIESSCPYILITNTRFEDNSAGSGDDIYADSSACFLGTSGGDHSLDGTCSTTTGGDRVRCNNTARGYLLNDCQKEIV